MHLNCTHCREHNDANIRAAMGCGWMALEHDEDENGKPLPPPQVWKHPQDTGPDPMVCPGYTTILPDVVDIAEAYPHYETSNLGIMFPEGVSRSLMDGFSALHTGIKVFINKPVKK